MANLKKNGKVNGAELVVQLESTPVIEQNDEGDNDKKMTEAGMASGAREKLGLISRQLEREAYLTRMAYIHQGFQEGNYSVELHDIEYKVNEKGRLVIKYKWTFLDVEVEHPNASLVRLNEVWVSTWETLLEDEFGLPQRLPAILRDLTILLGDYITLVDDPEASFTQRVINLIESIKKPVSLGRGKFKAYITPTSRNGFNSYQVELKELD